MKVFSAVRELVDRWEEPEQTLSPRQVVDFHYHDVEESLTVVRGEITFATVANTPFLLERRREQEKLALDCQPPPPCAPRWRLNDIRERIMTGELDAGARQALVELNEQFAAEEQRADREKEKDAARRFFEQHLSDPLVFHRASGQIVGKNEFLKGLTINPFEWREPEGISVSALDDRALVTLVIKAKRKDDGSIHRYRNIRLFLRASDKWIVEFWFNYEITGL